MPTRIDRNALSIVVYDIDNAASAYARTALSRRLNNGAGIRINLSVYLVKTSYVNEFRDYVRGLTRKFGPVFHIHTINVDASSQDATINLAETSLVSEVKNIRKLIADISTKLERASGSKKVKLNATLKRAARRVKSIEIAASLFGISGNITEMIGRTKRALTVHDATRRVMQEAA